MATNENIRETGQTARREPVGAQKAAARSRSAGAVGTAGAPANRPARPEGERRSVEQQKRRPAAEEPRRRKSAAEQSRRPNRKPAEETVRRPAEQPVDDAQAAEQATQEQVFRPDAETLQTPPAKRQRRPANENTGRAAKRAPAKKKTQASDSGYQPYKAANQRKKAEKAGKIKTFFSSQNPVLKLLDKESRRDAFAEDSELAHKRQEQRAAEAARKKKKQNPFAAPAVIYTQPQAFNRDRLIVQLLTVVAVVLALVMGLSVFFKVKVITVTGAEVYSPWAIREASGIKEGDNLLTFGRARASGQITANLPYVKSVRIGIKLPDTVNIEIDEENVVYAIKSEEGIWWLINSEGKVVDMANSSIAKNYTQVLGVTISAPQKNAFCTATEDIPTETDADGEYIPLTVTGAQRLNAALQILKALEANDIVGEAASVDVSRMEDIILWYGNRYQVNLGDTGRMDYKIACMCDAILQMSDYQTGILDISFTTWSDQVGYTPFQ